MRISDWSSDVCSSDLIETERRAAFKRGLKIRPAADRRVEQLVVGGAFGELHRDFLDMEPERCGQQCKLESRALVQVARAFRQALPQQRTHAEAMRGIGRLARLEQTQLDAPGFDRQCRINTGATDRKSTRLNSSH